MGCGFHCFQLWSVAVFFLLCGLNHFLFLDVHLSFLDIHDQLLQMATDNYPILLSPPPTPPPPPLPGCLAVLCTCTMSLNTCLYRHMCIVLLEVLG